MTAGTAAISMTFNHVVDSNARTAGSFGSSRRISSATAEGTTISGPAS